MIYSLPRHELDKLPSASSLTWSSGDSQFMWQGSVEPSYPNSEINGVTLGAKRVSKVQRFMLPFKIRPIPAHKKKINHGSCQCSHYSLDGGVPPAHPPWPVDIGCIELHFHRLLSWFKIETTFYIPFSS